MYGCSLPFTPSRRADLAPRRRLSQVYRVAGGIVKSAHSLSLLRKLHDPQEGRNSDELTTLVASLDGSLEEWVTSLSSRVKTAALSASDNPEFQTLCLLSFVVYYSGIINLREPFVSFRL